MIEQQIDLFHRPFVQDIQGFFFLFYGFVIQEEAFFFRRSASFSELKVEIAAEQVGAGLFLSGIPGIF